MADQKTPVARYCKVESVQTESRLVHNVSWDDSKIQNSFSTSERDDALLHYNLVTGRILSSTLWPLIFDQSEDPLIEKRTLAFMKRAVSEPDLLKQLNEQQARHFFVGVRDTCLAESRGLLSEDEKKIFRTLLDRLDDEFVPSAEHQSISFSFCPSKNRRVLKFIEKINELGDFDNQLLETIATLAVTIRTEADIDENDGMVMREASETVARFYAVWVDAQDLSYHNLENIIPLDRALCFDTKNGNRPPPLRLNINSIEQPNKEMNLITCKIDGPDAKLLLELDKLGLYQTPANASTRGGQRFIFSSTALSQGLTTAIKECAKEFFQKLARPKSVYNMRTFQFVNYVFRCNKFAPGDKKFEMHMDTPYFDAEKKHISKYTILIYLSGGKGAPALHVDNSFEQSVDLTALSTFDCVVFAQKYEHEGQAFIDGEKIFLRSELIFVENHEELVEDPAIGKLFSSAVYYTLQSTFQPEYSRHAHELYERVNKAHWRLKDDTLSTAFEPIVLHKRWNGLHFATNGNDYWFPHVTSEDSANQPLPHEYREKYLKMMATIAVLDYFNCRYGEKVEENSALKTFRKECSAEQLDVPNDVESKSGWIMSYLWTEISKESKHGDYMEFTDGQKKKVYFNGKLPTYEIPSEEIDQCCPQCDRANFIPWKCGYTRDSFEEEYERNEDLLLDSPLVLLDNRLQIDDKLIDVEGDKIYFRHNREVKHVNFAACWNSHSPLEFVGDQELIASPYLLIPPISFVVINASEDETSGGPGYRLLMDFFNNDWVIPTPDDLDQQISVPKLITTNEDEKEYHRRPNNNYSYYYSNTDDGYYAENFD